MRSATNYKSLPQSANPANAKSRSTSCEAGVSPSAPTEPGSSRRVSATARAAVQDNKAPQRKRQACSARRRKSNPSQRARARARALMICCVVGDHLPPTSTARTTRRDLARRPTSSGYLRSFRRSAMEMATPSLWSAPLLAVPSQCRALTSRVHRQLGSSEQWQPIHCHFESASIGCDGCVEVQVTQQHVCAHTATRLSADMGHHTLQSKPLPPQDPSPSAGSAVMAMSIKWAATGKNADATRGGGNRVIRHVGLVEKAKPLPGPPWNRCESREDVRVPVVPLHACTGLVLPTSTTSPLEFFHFVPCGPRSCNHVSPGWRFKPNPHQSVSNLPSLTQARGDSSSFQMMKKHGGDNRVPSVDHGEAICPTGPKSRTADTRGLPDPT